MFYLMLVVLRYKHFNCNQDRCTHNFLGLADWKYLARTWCAEMFTSTQSRMFHLLAMNITTHRWRLSPASQTHPGLIKRWCTRMFTHGRLACLRALIVFTRRVEIPNRNEQPSTDIWFSEHWCELRNHAWVWSYEYVPTLPQCFVIQLLTSKCYISKRFHIAMVK